MVIQLWFISSLYMAFWLPMALTEFIQSTVMPSFMVDQLDTIVFCTYFVRLFFPMMCLSALPELVKKMMEFLRKPKRNQIDANINDKFPRECFILVIH